MTDAPADPFITLGLEPRFDLDRAAVERAYLARVAKAHPDAAGGDAGAAARTAELNDARRTLLDGERRARALLRALGLESEGDRSLPDGFLESMLETRMDIEAAIAGGDESERDRWRAWAEQRRAEHAARTGAMFAKVDDDRDATGAELRTELNAWRYVERLAEQLDADDDPGRADFAGG